MWKCKWYRILFLWLSLLLVFSPVACSQPSATTEGSTQEGQPVSQKPAEFEVGPITFEPSTVMVGDSITATATVKNIGDIAGTYTAALSVDGQEVDKKDIAIEPGNSQEVSFQLSKTAAGNYNLAIGDSCAIMAVNEWTPCKIQYDESDWSSVGAYVKGEQGHIVHLTPPSKAFRIQKIKVFGTVNISDTSDYDKNHITVRIWDKDGNNQLWSQDFPWRLFFAGDYWREIKVPDVRVDDDFQVEVITHSNPQGDPIAFAQIAPGDIGIPDGYDAGGKIGRITGLVGRGESSTVLIGFDYPQSYIDAPMNRPETRSGYSYMGKLIDPGAGRLEGINWLIRVEGEGGPAN